MMDNGKAKITSGVVNFSPEEGKIISGKNQIISEKNKTIPVTVNPTQPKPEIIAVVVTYNRESLLRKTIDCLFSQTYPLSNVIVVDNGSTDSTAAFLEEKTKAAETAGRLTVIRQQNVGGAGGFRTGMSAAFDMDADWIWCMDDDVFPRPECMERLLAEAVRPGVGILAPRRLLEGEIYTNDFRRANLTNPFKSMYQARLSRETVDNPTEVSGTAFEGPLVRREVVSEIGLPNKDFFIFCDDTDYCLRTVAAGFKILYVPAALMDKHKFFSNDTWAERNEKKKWKRFYQIRNAAYLNHKYGRNWGVRYLRSFNSLAGYVLTALFTAPFSRAWKLADIPRLVRAYRDGIAHRLGIIPNTKH